MGGNLADVEGAGGSSFLGGAPGGETIINNYYDQPASGGDVASYADDQQRADLDNASYEDQGGGYDDQGDVQDDYADDGSNQGYDDISDGGGFDDGGDGDLSV